MRVQVVIVGAGPAGLLLGLLLHRAGIDTLTLERQTAGHVLSRIRAGLIEQSTIELIEQAGAGARMHREGIVINGATVMVNGRRNRLDVKGRTGKALMFYGQTEITRDLMDGGRAAGVRIVYEAAEVSVHDFDTDRPVVRYRKNGADHEIACDIIAGCDGYHGISRKSVPEAAIREYERVYPFGWMGLLSDTPPVNAEPLFIRHDRGFALCSMRSPTRSRYYVQCPLDDRVENWPDDRFWDELRTRLDDEARDALITGPSIEKSVAPLRSFVAEPMRFGRLFLAGDAAHIVPPTGAKGLNLAASDVRYLSEALIEFFKEKTTAGIDAYSGRALARVWKAERFSWWMTLLTHLFPDSAFERKMQLAELDYIFSSEHAQNMFAENYAGLPV